MNLSTNTQTHTEQSAKLDSQAYRTVAHSYLCSAEALARNFGFNKDTGLINFQINPDTDTERRFDILLNPSPFYYLLQHSLELYLKGYIHYCIKIQKHTHDLEDLMNTCEENGLHFLDLEKKTILLFQKFNENDYALRYPKEGTFDLPNIRTTIDLLYKIDKCLLLKFGY